jgi:hypothetical protein
LPQWKTQVGARGHLPLSLLPGDEKRTDDRLGFSLRKRVGGFTKQTMAFPLVFSP